MSHIRGRFSKPAADTVVKYTSSLPFDWRLYKYDIDGSIAHAKMLAKQNIIGQEDAKKITAGLEAIAGEIECGAFEFKPEAEDIHMAVEARLLEIIGQTAAKLHTARSRNDQVALDLRLFTKDIISKTIKEACLLQEALLEQAKANQETVLPGLTHLQPAQPILLAHHLLAYFEMLERDIERLNNCLVGTNVLPLGSGSLAGVAYDTDRQFLAKELGFSKISTNSMDAVSDRDFVVEYLATASIIMMHISRLAEEIIIWSSAGFSFVTLDDGYSTGSSLMPQKKNPDVAELARGKTGRVYGHLMAMLTALKALPLAYNRDLQEDKEAFFDAADTTLSTLEVMAGMVKTLTFNAGKMAAATEEGYLLATDLADYLVGKGAAFRDAHGIVANLTAHAASSGKQFSEMELGEYQKFSPLFEEDVFKVTVASSVASRNSFGGTSPKRVAAALAEASKKLKEKKSA